MVPDVENRYQITITDEDLADSYTFAATGLPTWMSLDASTGELSGSPTRADDGVYNMSITVTDGGGLSDTKVIEISSTSFEYSVLGSGDDLVLAMMTETIFLQVAGMTRLVLVLEMMLLLSRVRVMLRLTRALVMTVL